MMCATHQVDTQPNEARNVLTCEDEDSVEDSVGEDGGDGDIVELKIVIMIGMIKNRNFRRGYFVFETERKRVSYFELENIWSEKDKENREGKYLTED